MCNEGMFAVIENKTERNKSQSDVNNKNLDRNQDSLSRFYEDNLKIFNSILTDTLEIKEEYKADALNNWKVTFLMTVNLIKP